MGQSRSSADLVTGVLGVSDCNFLSFSLSSRFLCIDNILSADCKFLHPASRSSVNAKKPLQASHTHPGNTTISLAGGMSKSKKFGADGKQGGLNPDAVEFKPTGHGEDKTEQI